MFFWIKYVLLWGVGVGDVIELRVWKEITWSFLFEDLGCICSIRLREPEAQP